MHDLVAGGHGVVARRGVGHVGGGAAGDGHELVALEQLAGGQGDRGVLVGGAVVGPLLAGGRDGDLGLGLGHRQLAVGGGDGVVAGGAGGELVGLELVGDGRLAREGDRAGHGGGDGVVAHQAVDVVLGPAVGGAVVGERLVLRGDGHGLRADGEGARVVGNNVVPGDAIGLSLICLRALSDIRDRRGGAKDVSNGIGITIKRICDGIGSRQRIAVIGLALRGGIDRQRQRVVDSNDVAVSRNRHRLGRVVAVNREVLALVRIDRLRRVLGADGLLRRHVFGDLRCGALEVVVHGDRGLAQLEVRVIGVRLIEAV